MGLELAVAVEVAALLAFLADGLFRGGAEPLGEGGTRGPMMESGAVVAVLVRVRGAEYALVYGSGVRQSVGVLAVLPGRGGTGGVVVRRLEDADGCQFMVGRGTLPGFTPLA